MENFISFENKYQKALWEFGYVHEFKFGFWNKTSPIDNHLWADADVYVNDRLVGTNINEKMKPDLVYGILPLIGYKLYAIYRYEYFIGNVNEDIIRIIDLMINVNLLDDNSDYRRSQILTPAKFRDMIRRFRTYDVFEKIIEDNKLDLDKIFWALTNLNEVPNKMIKKDINRMNELLRTDITKVS